MHASIWRLDGDPADLAPRYDALLAELPPGQVALQLCLRAPQGLVIVDTCPTEEAFRAFASSPEFTAALARHGLPAPSAIEDHPVHRVVATARDPGRPSPGR